MQKKVLFTAHPSSDREKKNLLFLDLIKKRGKTSRTEISRLTNANTVTVSNYVNVYLKKGLVQETGYDVSSGGRRPELVELNKKWGYVIAIDIGPGRISAILADFGMKELTRECMNDQEEKELKDPATKIIKKLLENSKIDKSFVKKIGITANPDDVPGGMQKLKDEIEEEFEIPVLFGSPALCAAFGEKNLNPAATEAKNFLFIYTTLGEGVFFTDSEFFEAGKEGSGAEKYAYLAPWDRKLGIVEEAQRAVCRGLGTKMAEMALGDVKKITAEMVINAALGHDKVAEEILKTSATFLSVRTAYLVNLFEPEIVIIGGPAQRAEDLFLKPIARNIKKFSSHISTDRVKVLPAILGEEARAKGSASLAIREVFVEA